MSALKTKDPTFIAQYIKILCEKGDATRTTPTVAGTSSGTTVPARRSPLVDVSTSPHGLQILSQLFTSVTDEQRILILKTVRKNGVFLKGSKAGMRVNQLCGKLCAQDSPPSNNLILTNFLTLNNRACTGLPRLLKGSRKCATSLTLVLLGKRNFSSKWVATLLRLTMPSTLKL